MFWLGGLIGLFIGNLMGLVIASLLAAARRGDDSISATLARGDGGKSPDT